MSPTATNPALTNAPLNAFIQAVETQILLPLITLMALAAFIVFLWGVVEYVRKADDEESRRTGQQHMFWGIVGLVIIFGTTAIINLIMIFVNVI